MATNADDSYSAPSDFPITNDKSNYQLGRCPLCQSAKRVFYCQQCVTDGNFYHSNTLSERYAEKKMNYIYLKKQLRKIEEMCVKLLEKKIQVNDMKNDITDCQDRIRILQSLINEKKENINAGKHHLEILTKSNQQKSKLKLNTLTKNRIKELILFKQQQTENNKFNRQHGTRQDKLANISEITDESKKNKEAQLLKLQDIQRKLRNCIKKNIQNLNKYIFPIHQVQPVQCEVSNIGPDSATVCALADASRTTYVKGRWILTDTSGELHHCIVAPRLPGSGDYSAYNIWVATNKVSNKNEPSPDRNRAYSIIGALQYATQLVNILSFYLDIQLPYCLNYSEFSGNELNDQQFARKVAKLNSNILFLCFSQNINPELIQPTHTLNNLLELINSQCHIEDNQGKPFEIESSLAKVLVEPLSRELEINHDSSDEESDCLTNDWETIALTSCPEICASLQQASFTGGLVTSAAASIASIFRGFAGNNE